MNKLSNTGASVSHFDVPKMDCPSEERMIRLALDDLDNVRAVAFDLPKRQLQVTHSGNPESILARLTPLGLGAVLTRSEAVSDEEVAATIAQLAEGAAGEAGTLKLLLAINGFMFVLELAVGWWAQSAGLIADSLDMFADAAVYGLALYAVGRAANTKMRAARMAGWLQLVLALGVIGEVLRRMIVGSEPVSLLMMGMASVALIANVSCLLLISRNRDAGVHMKASYIFSANDVIANTGVIVAAGLVYVTGSRYPDLIIGLIIGVIVLLGARRILALRS